jgi:DHA1 family tetracycline resistance protein-like MFS transporter
MNVADPAIAPTPDAAAGDAPPPARRAAAMRFIMLAVLIDMTAIGLIVPVLPGLVGTFTASPTEQTWWFGAVTLAFGVANFFGSPILGALSDRFGRRPVLLLGFSGLALSFFVTGLATALWMLIAVRLFSGAMQANASVANAYVADITPPHERARRFGLLGAMFGLGFVIGPAIGGVLGQFDVHWPFFFAGALAVANWLYGWFVLPESLPAERRRAFDWKRANPFSALGSLLKLEGAGKLPLVVGLSALSQFTLHTTWVLYTSFKFGWGPAQVGASLFVVGLMAVLVQGVLLKHMLRLFSARTLVVGGLLASAATHLGFGLATQGWMMFVIIVIGNILGGGAIAAVQGTISGAAGAHEQGRTLGSLGSINSLMAVLAPVVATPLMGVVAHRPPGDLLMGLPFYFCALMQLTAAALAYQFYLRHPEAARAHGVAD